MIERLAVVNVLEGQTAPMKGGSSAILFPFNALFCGARRGAL